MADGTVLIVGGTGGIGREIAAHYGKGRDVIITGRDPTRPRRSPELGSECIGQCRPGTSRDHRLRPRRRWPRRQAGAVCHCPRQQPGAASTT